jgi:hypothetical protein
MLTQIWPYTKKPDQLYAIQFSETRQLYYRDFILIYTDGSKTEEGVGVAAICHRTVHSQTLPIEASIYILQKHMQSIWRWASLRREGSTSIL